VTRAVAGRPLLAGRRPLRARVAEHRLRHEELVGPRARAHLFDDFPAMILPDGQLARAVDARLRALVPVQRLVDALARGRALGDDRITGAFDAGVRGLVEQKVGAVVAEAFVGRLHETRGTRAARVRRFLAGRRWHDSSARRAIVADTRRVGGVHVVPSQAFLARLGRLVPERLSRAGQGRAGRVDTLDVLVAVLASGQLRPVVVETARTPSALMLGRR
jgi:hypothetical protein